MKAADRHDSRRISALLLPTVLFGLTLTSFVGCKADKCEDLPAQAQIDVVLEGISSSQVAKTVVALNVNNARDFQRQFAVPAPSFVFVFDDWDKPPRRLTLRATAHDADGKTIGSGHLETTFSSNGCNHFSVTVYSAGEMDGGVADAPGDVQTDGPPTDLPIVDGPDAAPLDTGPPDVTSDGREPDSEPVDGGVVGEATWIIIPAGTFMMGSPANEPCRQSNEDKHQVTLTHAFEIQSTEATQGQFEAAMGYNPSHFGPNGSGADCGVDCPVEMVNWHESAAYCNALSVTRGLAECYACTGSGPSVTCSGNTAYGEGKIYECPGYRLPTEAEWEHAYRAGTTTALYAGPMSSCTGADPIASQIGWYDANSGKMTHPAAQLQANDWGLFDMPGSVYEWCHDYYHDALGSAPVVDPWGAATGSAHVVRGGTWAYEAGFLRGAHRSYGTHSGRGERLGVRCVRTLTVPGTWVTIPAGTFTMGSPTAEPCRVPDETEHPVSLTHDFEIQSTEVTQEQFQDVVGYGPSYFTACGGKCPVESVNWHEAVAYCNALSRIKGVAECYACTGSGESVVCSEAAAYGGADIYDCPGYRLPTEAEWEHAYRAGTTAAYYNGANDASKCSTCSSKDANADQIGWYCANSGVGYAGCHDLTPDGGPSCAGPHPVGQKQPNASGLYDMAGNVWEWCNDWHAVSLGTSAVTDPFGVAPGSKRVIRGGSWYLIARYLRGAYRYGLAPTDNLNRLGFRCGRALGN